MSLSVRPLAIGDREEDTGDGVVPGVVGEHAAHGDTAGAEVGERALQEGSAGRSALVGQGLDVGIAAVVVDGDVQVVEAGAASAWGLAGASVGAVSAAVGNACQLLHVQVQQVTGGRIEALREVGAEVVRVQLERIEPLLQLIYSTIDPHPSFRSVRFVAEMFRGYGRMTTPVEDSTEHVTVDAPEHVLSSSQANTLATSVFLSLNLGVATLPLTAALLDDPIQSFDDVNLLGLVDLLRRVKQKRQLILSTHDVHFGNMLRRKLRPINAAERTVVVNLDGWGRRGPRVKQFDVQRDDVGLRIAI